jgi:hypothetical protein
MRHRQKKVKPVCCEYGCDSPRYCFGRCKAHFASLDSKSYKRLKRMSRAERIDEFQKAILPPEKPKWEYEGREGELIAALDAKERRNGK